MNRNGKHKILVLAQHIDRGIEKYKGAPAPAIQTHVDNASWNYSVYQFADGRVLLVYPNKSFGILYQSEDALYMDMEKERLNSQKGLDDL